ncbi:hypothetical protein NQ318_006505 [Aromia moschata]|uniref:Uncharacterized protein n=1 Tax=Aromia moschata TaxID=1265417 RepID=A0AAV8YPM5_9CUCU|nr:hypothetical protein NQ318_006505 [Aromia moschata]
MLLPARCERVATSLNRTVSGDTFPTLSSLDMPGGGGIVNHLRKSYSLSDLTDVGHDDDGRDEADDVVITDPRLLRRRRSPHRSSSSASAIYFSEVDVRADRIGSIQSAEDISSGYSSGEGLYSSGQPVKLLAREGLHRTGSLTRSRTSRVTRSTTTIKKSGGSDDSDENEVFDTNIVFDKPPKTKPVTAEKADSSSEDEFLDTLDTLHDKKLGEDLNIFNKNPLLTACRERERDLDVVNCSLTKSHPMHTAPSLNLERGDTDRSDKVSLSVNTLNIVNITKDVNTFSNFLQNLIEYKMENINKGSKKVHTGDEDGDTDVQTKTEAVKSGSKSGESKKIEQLGLPSSSDRTRSETRGGRYNKKTAPPPPKLATSVEDPSPIKATLVLKPGLVKNVGPKESPSKEIFIQSPKSKRRKSVNRSPSSASNSSASSRSKHSLAKLMKLPKKIVFWNKDELSVPNASEKRSSWHSFLDDDLQPLSDSKVQSKSDNDLARFKSLVGSLRGPGVSKTDSQLSIRSLTESPLAHRRLKIIRRYVDEDID